MGSEDVLKKEKKKQKKTKTEETSNGSIENSNGAIEEVGEKSSKKRKREALPEELAIDVSLPEPPSKKALRKAKKAKPSKDDGAESADAPAEGTKTEKSKTSKSKDEKDGKDRRTEHSIWIGNLPWTASKDEVRDFICSSASIEPSQIVRLHLPAPKGANDKDPRNLRRFLNKGFAYIDFDSQETLFAALQITETAFGTSGRNVLVKSAKSFEGRPEEHAVKADDAQKPASKRVFVGNLAFETTKDDLQAHYGQCGEIEHIHMATFEDSGNCKGFAWITFKSVEASAVAVRGFIIKQPEPTDSDAEDSATSKKAPKSATEGFTEDDLKSDAEARSIVQQRLKQQARKAKREEKRKKEDRAKGRKWFVNRLQGRELRCEFAEDDTTRYKKRFGSGVKKVDGEGEGEGEGEGRTSPARSSRDEGIKKDEKSSHDRRREARRAARGDGLWPKVDARTIKPGAALAHAQKASAAIVEASGKKITFD